MRQADADAAVRAFVEGRRTALLRSAWLLCGNRDEAEDLVQSTLVKVVLGGRRLEYIDNLEAYARRTLVNTFIASRRRFWWREHAYGELPEGVQPLTGEDADTGLVVRAALARLGPKQRAVLAALAVISSSPIKQGCDLGCQVKDTVFDLAA
ncbi:sigma factor [Streptomyces sp. NPDC020983]|uniref:sigma factor n=1 Tax=Streptomyces sp. NPDC020983 TaxID=3365106 RepID=UPI0037BC67D6